MKSSKVIAVQMKLNENIWVTVEVSIAIAVPFVGLYQEMSWYRTEIILNIP